MKKKKIGLLFQTSPQYGGGYQYALQAVNCLVEKAETDYEIVVLCGNTYWQKWCREKGVRFLGHPLPDISIKEQQFICRYPFLTKLWYTNFTLLGRGIRAERIDILFSPQQGLFIPNYNVKIISPVHDLMHRYEPGFPEVRSGFEEREIYMKCLAAYTTCVLVDSGLGRQQFKESYMKMEARKPYVVSLPFIVPDHIWDAVEEYVEVPEKFIFYPAQFWQHKNHINLLKAVKILRETIKDIHLVLVGSEKNYYRVVKKYISDNELTKYVTVLGFVNNEKITYLYKHAVGMVMPSYFGPTNIPPLEAMALGCPVAVSNKYAMPRQVGNAGLLFDPDSPDEIADCIKRMWLDEDLRNRMKALGYKRAQKWTRKEFGERLQKIMNTV